MNATSEPSSLLGCTVPLLPHHHPPHPEDPLGMDFPQPLTTTLISSPISCLRDFTLSSSPSFFL